MRAEIRRVYARIDWLLIRRREVPLRRIDREGVTRDRQRTAPIVGTRRPVLEPVPTDTSRTHGETSRRANGNRSSPVGDDPVLRRHGEARHRSQPLRYRATARGPRERVAFVRRVVRRPARRDPQQAFSRQWTAMRVQHRVGGDDLAAFVAIYLDARLEWLPHAIEPVARGMPWIIDHLDEVVQNVGLHVRERPRNVAIESDDDPGRPRDRYAVDVDLSRNDEMRFVPDRGKRKLEVRVSSE